MLLGHWLEMRSVLGASKALEALAALMPDQANLIIDDQITEVKVSTLKSGDIILIKPGEKVPADGVIIEAKVISMKVCSPGKASPSCDLWIKT